MSAIRDELVATALEWQKRFGVAPAITSAISELDAALLVGMTENEYSSFMQSQTAVQKGHDFVFKGIRYQVKANRPSGKPGSKVTLVPKAKNYEWDILVWLLYNKEYELQEAWGWQVDTYKQVFHEIKRLSPKHYRGGNNLLIKSSQ
ncbi:hypothetical protein A3740_17415 [Oleiphilus sp. HI0068]|uniref:hypothetical protein n=1 Tax=Oleiphilus sp. HI0132 TaxID=1822270 RepID=UPI0007C21AA1|nr:hypothetical protein [Oleiphilus sp. HI0132]KZY73614.1 hypothetical protein A3740_18630 [Oleiphilus sp. HI0068]KZY74144.1 hypothetical protein A3740_17415 [Oleiphilus sp. HI0068]KZY81320.1 hypothetical protein A3741_17395 [Oleiphilus sp. HI0069]KZZ75451.1 hypothetical protein A3766_16595 [Oleiphilus sp. HI0132]